MAVEVRTLQGDCDRIDEADRWEVIENGVLALYPTNSTAPVGAYSAGCWQRVTTVTDPPA